MNKWQKYKIEDVCDFIGGSQPPKSTFLNYQKENYVRLVQTRDFKTDKFPTYIPVNSTTKFFGKEDIIIGRYGPPIFQIFRGILDGAYNVALMKAVPKKNITNDFLYYFLTQKKLFEYVDKLSARTGGQTGVDLVSLNKYPINLPDKTDQQKIASVLSVLDSKIVLNNKINIELDAMVKTLYDYWFVQFDFPNDNGKPYKSNGGKMIWNNELKKEIPKGWCVKKVSDLLPVVTGKQDANFATENGEYNFFTCGEEILKCNTYEFEGKAILIAGNGNFNIKLYEGKFNAYQRTYILIPNDERYYTLVYLAVRDRITSLSKGSRGSIVKFITKGDLEDIKIPLPENENLDIFSQLNIITKKIEKNILENQKLIELRDWLLPMLMNGQINIK